MLDFHIFNRLCKTRITNKLDKVHDRNNFRTVVYLSVYNNICQLNQIGTIYKKQKIY